MERCLAPWYGFCQSLFAPLLLLLSVAFPGAHPGRTRPRCPLGPPGGTWAEETGCPSISDVRRQPRNLSRKKCRHEKNFAARRLSRLAGKESVSGEPNEDWNSEGRPGNRTTFSGWNRSPSAGPFSCLWMTLRDPYTLAWSLRSEAEVHEIQSFMVSYPHCQPKVELARWQSRRQRVARFPSLQMSRNCFGAPVGERPRAIDHPRIVPGRRKPLLVKAKASRCRHIFWPIALYPAGGVSG